MAALGASLAVSSPRASAATCADVEVVFARGTVEPAPPIGLTGISFVETLRTQLGGKSLRAYGVNYPASNNFNNRLRFAQQVVSGINDAQARVKYLAAKCPRTRIVLGGYSQGAVVAGYAANGGIAVPAQYREYASRVPGPLPPAVADHVAAIVLFAPPSDRWITDIGAPPIRIAAPYRARTVRYCIPGDTVCNGAPVGQPNGLHVLYAVNGMTLEASRFVVSRL
ncbi:alpha/beta fold hydrolase [Gordonia sinesedis]